MGYIEVKHRLGGFDYLDRQLNSGLKGFFSCVSDKILLYNIKKLRLNIS